MLAQIDVAEKVFKETANTYTLAIAILIAILLFFLGLFVVTIRWAKPKVESLINSHLATMHSFRENSVEQASTLRKILSQHKETCDKLEKILQATNETTMTVQQLGCVSGTFVHQTSKKLTGLKKKEMPNEENDS